MEKKKLRKINDREVKSLGEEIDRLNEKLIKSIKREIRSALRDDDILSMLLDNQSDHMTRFNKKIYELFDRKLDLLQKKFDTILNLNELSEETLRNVHVAIQQNDYLQAWYPSQQGYPAMKVVGSHPIQEERRRKRHAAEAYRRSNSTEEA